MIYKNGKTPGVDSKPGESKGHIMFRDGYEYFRFERDVFQVPQAAHMHTNGTLKGIRVGARFYCTYAAWMQSPLMRQVPI